MICEEEKIMVRPLAFITASWNDNAYEAKEEAAKYSR